MKSEVLIIAEAGVNHNGDINLAKNLIDVAVNAGVDYVKFQTFKAEKLVTKLAKKADYQIINSKVKAESQFEMIKKLELDRAAHIELINYCSLRGIKFLSTAFDIDSIDLLVSLGVELFKIPSGEITNLPYLKKIGSLGFPIILSTGMAELSEVEETLEVLKVSGAKIEDITVLHCNTEYPTQMRDVNLKAMLTMRDMFGVKIGYSDHTLGIEVPIAAVALGASCIEKHFTLDRKMEGPDHIASLEPNELKEMVKSIRNIELVLGDGIKKPSLSETKNRIIARKSLHTARKLNSGHILTFKDIKIIRPGNGISPMRMDDYIGKVLDVDLPKNTLIKPQHFR